MRLYGVFLELSNARREIDLMLPEKATLRDLINVLREKFGDEISKRLLDENNKLRRRGYVILINGDAVREEDPEKILLQEDAEIAILPTAVGGRKQLCV